MENTERLKFKKIRGLVLYTLSRDQESDDNVSCSGD
jgi:hypothetical protein